MKFVFYGALIWAVFSCSDNKEKEPHTPLSNTNNEDTGLTDSEVILLEELLDGVYDPLDNDLIYAGELQKGEEVQGILEEEEEGHFYLLNLDNNSIAELLIESTNSSRVSIRPVENIRIEEHRSSSDRDHGGPIYQHASGAAIQLSMGQYLLVIRGFLRGAPNSYRVNMFWSQLPTRVSQLTDVIKETEELLYSVYDPLDNDLIYAGELHKGEKVRGILEGDEEGHFYLLNLDKSSAVEYLLECDDGCRMDIRPTADIFSNNHREEADSDHGGPIYSRAAGELLQLSKGQYVFLVRGFLGNRDNIYRLELR